MSSSTDANYYKRAYCEIFQTLSGLLGMQHMDSPSYTVRCSLRATIWQTICPYLPKKAKWNLYPHDVKNYFFQLIYTYAPECQGSGWWRIDELTINQDELYFPITVLGGLSAHQFFDVKQRIIVIKIWPSTCGYIVLW